MTIKKDTLGRRDRRLPVSTGKRVGLTDRDLLWLRRLRVHGPLPTSFLLRLAVGEGDSVKRARERLTDLFNEAETPHGGPYLTRPPQQFHTLDSRYNQIVYDLAPAGRKALEALPDCPPPPSLTGPWLHRFMTSTVVASVRLAVEARSDVRFITEQTILARANASIDATVALPDPRTRQVRKVTLRPDALFGIEYLTQRGSRFRFFAVEADRSTEPLTSTNFNRKSAEKQFELYRAYIGEGAYKAHLKLTSPLLVLNVSSDPARTAKLIDLGLTKFGPQSFQLFQSWEAFSPPFRPPDPNDSLLLSAWQRPGHSPMIIAAP